MVRGEAVSATTYGLRQCVSKRLVLLANKLNLGKVRARPDSQPHPNVVAIPDLIHKPPDTMRVMRFVTGHYVSRLQDRTNRIVSYRRYQRAVLLNVVAIRNLERVYILAPRTFCALLCSLQFPLLTHRLVNPGEFKCASSVIR